MNVSFCGTKPITLAVLDGFGINAWSQALVRGGPLRGGEVQEREGDRVPPAAATCRSRSPTSARAVAQGANAIVVIPDFGQSELAAIQQATQAGVKVVPWGADPGGKAGTDYVSYVDWNCRSYAGTIWANWMVKALHGKGNVIYLGGPAGNPVGMDAAREHGEGVQEAPGDASC